MQIAHGLEQTAHNRWGAGSNPVLQPATQVALNDKVGVVWSLVGHFSAVERSLCRLNRATVKLTLCLDGYRRNSRSASMIIMFISVVVESGGVGKFASNRDPLT